MLFRKTFWIVSFLVVVLLPTAAGLKDSDQCKFFHIYTVNVNETVNLTCPGVEIGAYAILDWQKCPLEGDCDDGHDCQWMIGRIGEGKTDSEDKRLHITREGTLRISKVHLTDTARYRCSVDKGDNTTPARRFMALCVNDIDDCAGQPKCLHGGTCIDGVNSYSCLCADGYTGKNCNIDTDDCAGQPKCLHGGTCIDGVNSYSCLCADGYTGKNCNIDIYDCAGQPKCLHGGTCIDGVNSYSCLCADGYTGKNCNIDIDDCAGQPKCLHGGTCIDGVNSYSCLCADGYNGKNCNIDIDDCADQSRCLNGGTCIDGVNDYCCVCADGYTGKNCSIGKSNVNCDCTTKIVISVVACVVVVAVIANTNFLLKICRRLRSRFGSQGNYIVSRKNAAFDGTDS